MRRLLYITPYFPPQTRVGALRPLKFVRHLREFGWEPIVLTDFEWGEPASAQLLDALPPELTIHRTYRPGGEWRAQRSLRASSASNTRPRMAPEPRSNQSPLSFRGQKSLMRARFEWHPETFPLGAHGLWIPLASREAIELAKRHDADAVMANADPFAAMLVAEKVGKNLNIPVIQDLRDPWGPCDLRGPTRPAHSNRYIHKTELRLIEGSSAYVLNTDATREAYQQHYSTVPAERFAVIRNHADPELFDSTVFERGKSLRIAYIGTFRRYVHGDPMLRALAALRHEYSPGELQLIVTGPLSEEAERSAQALGVLDYIRVHPLVPYTDVGAFMAASDVLVASASSSAQRIPAKFFDYAVSGKPFVVIAASDHRELRALTDEHPLGVYCDRDDDDAVADGFRRALAMRGQAPPKAQIERFSSRKATEALAALLNQAVANHPRDSRARR